MVPPRERATTVTIGAYNIALCNVLEDSAIGGTSECRGLLPPHKLGDQVLEHSLGLRVCLAADAHQGECAIHARLHVRTARTKSGLAGAGLLLRFTPAVEEAPTLDAIVGLLQCVESGLLAT